MANHTFTNVTTTTLRAQFAGIPRLEAGASFVVAQEQIRAIHVGLVAEGKLSVTPAIPALLTANTAFLPQAPSIGQASKTEYTPTTPGDWDTAPTQVKGALDSLAADVAGLAPGGAPPVAGTVEASKTVVVDSNKDIADFRNLSGTNLKAGKDAVAGSVTVFPATTAKGKLVVTVSDQTGNTQVTQNFAAMGQATTITTPDPGAAAASHVLTESVQTINGLKTFSAGLKPAGATGTTDAPTVNQPSGKITTAVRSEAAGVEYTITLTDSFIAAADLVFASVDVNAGAGTPVVASITPAAGSCTIKVRNAHATNAFTTAHKISFLVIKQ